MKLVLSAFSFSLFAHNHSLTSSRHFPNRSKAIFAFLCQVNKQLGVVSVEVKFDIWMFRDYFAQRCGIQRKKKRTKN